MTTTTENILEIVLQCLDSWIMELRALEISTETILTPEEIIQNTLTLAEMEGTPEYILSIYRFTANVWLEIVQLLQTTDYTRRDVMDLILKLVGYVDKVIILDLLENIYSKKFHCMSKFFANSSPFTFTKNFILSSCIVSISLSSICSMDAIHDLERFS